MFFFFFFLNPFLFFTDFYLLIVASQVTHSTSSFVASELISTWVGPSNKTSLKF